MLNKNLHNADVKLRLYFFHELRFFGFVLFCFGVGSGKGKYQTSFYKLLPSPLVTSSSCLSAHTHTHLFIFLFHGTYV